MIVMVKEFENIVTAMQDEQGKPFCDYGHRQVIANQLTEKEKDAVLKDKKYPLIALRQDFPERVVDGVYHFKLNIVIVTMTEKQYNSKERYDNVLIPELYPLYERFFKQLRLHKFMWKGNQKLPNHVKIDRPHWGIPASEGNLKNVFSDPLDGIEIIDLEISKRDITC
jgi:hypothetical protein